MCAPTHPEKTLAALSLMAPKAPKPGMMTCRWATGLDARAAAAVRHREPQLRRSMQSAMLCRHTNMDDGPTGHAICQQKCM